MLNLDRYFEMAIHETEDSMLKESLPEILTAARLLTRQWKSGEHGGSYHTLGVSGYPSAILLFTIIDTIGTYCRKRKGFMGTNLNKKGAGWESFKILHEPIFHYKDPRGFTYDFQENLDLNDLKKIYNFGRSALSHNSVVRTGIVLYDNSETDLVMPFWKSDDSIWVDLKALYKACEQVVDQFIRELD